MAQSTWVTSSAAFQEGFAIGLDHSEHTGWPIDEPPCEKSLVEVISTVGQIIHSADIGEAEISWLVCTWAKVGLAFYSVHISCSQKESLR